MQRSLIRNAVYLLQAKMSEATRGPRNVQENKQKNNLHCTANGRPTEDKEKKTNSLKKLLLYQQQ